MKRTPFFNKHLDLKAKMIHFGNWEMPVQYTSIIEEHKAVRSSVGIFDVSHMGEIVITGKEAMNALQNIITNDLTRLSQNQVQYTAMCYPHGGIVDDLLVYKFNDEHFLLCVNASNTEKDFNWIKENTPSNVLVENKSDEFAQLAIQGPNSSSVIQKLVDFDIRNIKYYWFQIEKIKGVEMIISRTGYTGEDGFELYFDHKFAEMIWDTILDAGQEYNIKPVGLGARDTLRLEMGYCLYGNDIDETTSPLQAGLEWITKLKKPSFIGKEAIEKEKKEGIKRKLIGFEILESGIARYNYPIYFEGKEIGKVTSGTLSPTLNKAIGMGYVETLYAEVGKEIDIGIRNRKVKAKIIKPPFYDKKVYK